MRELRTEESRETVGEIFELVERLEQAVKSCSAAAAGGAPESSDRSRRRNKLKRYRVSQHGNARCLAERREGGRQAYPCPREACQALAAEVNDIADPVQFPVLLQRVAAQIGKELPHYLLRTCVRFWMAVTPALVLKIRTRYRPIRPSTSARDAHRAWYRLGRASDE